MLAAGCLLAFAGDIALGFGSILALSGAASAPSGLQAQRALRLLDGQTCAMRVARQQSVVVASAAEPTGSPSPAPTASPMPTPSFAPTVNGSGQLYATPFPNGNGAAVTPPPVPTPTPVSTATNGPVFLVRPSGAPPSIAPVGQPAGSPAPAPTAAGPTPVPTLPPGEIAVLADKFVGNTKPGKPGDALGNVHIFYQDEVLVGERAHYDGYRTITVTGNPYIINGAKNSIIYADSIKFDTIAQKAELINGRGESTQGVEKGLVYFSARDLKSNANGVAHGDYASVTTCANPRSGYHITGRTIDVTPGDRIVVTKAILWLGAAAVFFLPRVVIPLRQVVNQTQRPTFFPEVGYNSYQGYYVKVRYGFGRDQYYYGYYRLEYFSRQGLGLGYVAYLAKKNGKRQSSINYYGMHDRIQGVSNHNLTVTDLENFSRTLRANLNFAYVSNYGPLSNVPANTSLSGSIAHTGERAQQNYTFSRNAVGSQSSTNNVGFSDTRQFRSNLSNALNFTLNSSQTSYGGFFSSNSSAIFNDLLHWSTRGANYQLTFDKSFSRTPYGIDKLPELQIQPSAFFRHFVFPLSAQFTVGEYAEPQNAFNTTRADLGFTLGPALYKIYNSDFNATVNVDQYAYGTGDLKAAIRQNMSLSTPVGSHVVNSLSYNESNYNGPPLVPFQTLDLLPSQNFKTAQDVLRIFNQDYYNLALGFGTTFNRTAGPISYTLNARPSARSYLTLGGSFQPGPGNGFYSTNVQFATPFGRNATLQFLGDVNWKERGRIENKTIYYSRIIGDCYRVNVLYNQAQRTVNVTVDILAFPSHAATFGINTAGGQIVQYGGLNTP